MAYLSPAVRRTLGKTIQDAQAGAERGAADALRRLASRRRAGHRTLARHRRSSATGCARMPARSAIRDHRTAHKRLST